VPECHGVLRQVEVEGPLRFRCHTGHGYSIASLLSAVNDSVDQALWIAIRAIDESGRVLRHVAKYGGGGDAEGRGDWRTLPRKRFWTRRPCVASPAGAGKLGSRAD
jgi:two-component system chemotaxis response regulator CheB